MSYCRWSSDNFKSDVYVYDSCHGGVVIHVASLRVVGDPPQVPPLNAANTMQVVQAMSEQSEWLTTASHERIGLEHDGATFHVSDHEQAASVLKELRGKGYCVPQFAIDTLLEVAQEDLLP